MAPRMVTVDLASTPEDWEEHVIVEDGWTSSLPPSGLMVRVDLYVNKYHNNIFW